MTKNHVYFYTVIKRHGYVLRTPAVCSLSLILSVLVFFTDEFWLCFHPAYITWTPEYQISHRAVKMIEPSVFSLRFASRLPRLCCNRIGLQ